MSKVRQRTLPLSCSRHKRNGCRAQAQAALPTMMSGFHCCLHADVTWVGSGEKKERVFMSTFLLPNAGGGQEPNRVRHGWLVIIILCYYTARDRRHETCQSPTS